MDLYVKGTKVGEHVCCCSEMELNLSHQIATETEILYQMTYYWRDFDNFFVVYYSTDYEDVDYDFYVIDSLKFEDGNKDYHAVKVTEDVNLKDLTMLLMLNKY